MLGEIGEFQVLKSSENEEFEVCKIDCFEFESGASLEFDSLSGNPAWKFEAAATRFARRSQATDRGRTRRGSQSSPQEFEFEKPHS